MEILNSKILGESEKHLLIVHGLFGQLDNWNTLGKKYAEEFTTHLIDLRNHGRSFHSDETSHEAMSQDLLNYMEQNSVPKASLMGHSLGGKVVMDFALNHPEKVEKLIVADMAPKSYPPHHQGIIKGLNNVDFQKVETRADVEPFMEPYIPVTSVRQFLLKNVYRKDDGKYDFRFNLEALARDYDDLVSTNLPKNQFDGPTLFLGGENSDYILATDKPIIKSYFPSAIIDYVSGAGHWIHAENPTEFLQKTLDFLQST